MRQRRNVISWPQKRRARKKGERKESVFLRKETRVLERHEIKFVERAERAFGHKGAKFRGGNSSNWLGREEALRGFFERKNLQRGL